MLKLGDKTVMVTILPTMIFGLLFAIPYIDRNPHRSVFKRPFAVAPGLLFALTLVALSYMGTPQFGIETPSATRILQDLVPEEGTGPLREIPFDQLQTMVYEVGVTQPVNLCPDLPFGCPALEAVFTEFGSRVKQAESEGKFKDPRAVLLIEDWQANLKKITLRIVWADPESGATKTYDRHIFIHKDGEDE